MITFTLNLNPNSGYPILAQGGLSTPGSVPVLTVGDRCTLALKFWEGPQGSSALTNKRIVDFSYIKFGSKISKSAAALILYTDEFTEGTDTDGSYFYSADLNLNVVSLIEALNGRDSVEVFSDVEITFTDGQRQTTQFKHIIRNQVVDNANPPVFVTEPTAIVFADMVSAYQDSHPGASVADFLASLQSTTPGPTGADGTVTGSNGVIDLGGVSRNLDTSDNGKIIINTGSDCTVTVPSGVLPDGFLCEIIQLDGQVTVAGSGVTVGNAFGFTKTRSVYSVASIRMILPTIAILAGDIV